MSLLRGSSGSEAARLIKQLSDLLALVLVGAEKSTREAKRQLGQTFDPLSPFQVYMHGMLHATSRHEPAMQP